MKIVINAFSARIGGGKTYLVNLLRNFPADSDLEVHLFAHPGLQIAEDPRIRLVQTAWPVTNPLSRALWEIFGLPAYLRRVRADILFCPGGVVATKAPAACRVVTMFRNMAPFDPAARGKSKWSVQRLRNRILVPLMLKSMRDADLTIFISEHARRVIEGKVRIPNPVTIPHGIAPAFRSHATDLPRPPEAGSGDYLLYVSRFESYKHHYEVVQAFAALPEQDRADVRLLLAGEADSADARRVEALAKNLGIEDRIVFLGGVPYDRLPALYRNARANLFASSCENCPNILLEALGAGQPVLSSNVMPMPEFGGSEIAYFSPFDPRDISEQMQRVLQDGDYAARLGAASAKRAGLFDWGKTARATWAEIMMLASGTENPDKKRPAKAARNEEQEVFRS